MMKIMPKLITAGLVGLLSACVTSGQENSIKREVMDTVAKEVIGYTQFNNRVRVDTNGSMVCLRQYKQGKPSYDLCDSNGDGKVDTVQLLDLPSLMLPPCYGRFEEKGFKKCEMDPLQQSVAQDHFDQGLQEAKKNYQ